jgi:hypothetical protein
MTTDPAREAAEKHLRDKFNREYRKASPFKLDPAVIAARIAADFAERLAMLERGHWSGEDPDRSRGLEATKWPLPWAEAVAAQQKKEGK